ncbi:MAG: hypothetical protein V3S44_06805 [Alphaproteobacteria bacterium]
MRNGVIISGLLHLAIVLLAALGLPTMVRDAPAAAKPIPVELVVMKKPPAPNPPKPATPKTVRPAPKPPEAVPEPPKAAPAKPPQTAALPPIPRRQPATRARSKTGPTPPPPRRRRKRSRAKKPHKEMLAGAWIFRPVVIEETGRCGNAQHSAILLIRRGASGNHLIGAGRATIKWAKCPRESYRFELVLRLSGNVIMQLDGRGETEIGRIRDGLMYLQNRAGVVEVWRRRKGN